MNKHEITATMNEITARENATAEMKKEEEKKMTTATIETVSETRKALITTARKQAKALDNARADMGKTTWKEGVEASEALTKALTKALNDLNDDMLTEVYKKALESACPVATLCKALTYSKWYAKTNKKDNVTMLESRSTRLNLIHFLNYASESETYDSPKNANEIMTALADTARKVSDYVLDTLKNEKTMSIQTPKKALNTLFQLIGVEGVVARSIDMRYIVYASTRARDLGELAEITYKTIVPYIMDVISVQLRGVEYKFEEKKEEEKA